MHRATPPQSTCRGLVFVQRQLAVKSLGGNSFWSLTLHNEEHDLKRYKSESLALHQVKYRWLADPLFRREKTRGT